MLRRARRRHQRQTCRRLQAAASRRRPSRHIRGPGSVSSSRPGSHPIAAPAPRPTAARGRGRDASASAPRGSSRGTCGRGGRAPAAQRPGSPRRAAARRAGSRAMQLTLARRPRTRACRSPSRRARRRTPRCRCARRPPCPSSCSGAMYWNVPTIAPCAVRVRGERSAAIEPPPRDVRRRRLARGRSPPAWRPSSSA